jgi:Tol biopolymer transport system component
MNKDFLNQLSKDEQAVAQKLHRTAENMKISWSFQSKLESQLRERYQAKSRSRWGTKLLPTLGFVLMQAVIVGILIWSATFLIPKRQPAAVVTLDPNQFINAVKSGDICNGPLAVAHGFSAFLLNPASGEFIELDDQKAIGELRDIQWSPDGQKLAVLGNSQGAGNLYLYNFDNQGLRPVMPGPGLDYLTGFTWAHNGEQLATWEAPSAELYTVNLDGTSVTEIRPASAFLDGAQFAPGDQSILYSGSFDTQAGLVEIDLASEQTRMVSEFSPTGFSWSPDGARLAYTQVDWEMRETRLIIDDQGSESVIAALPFQNSVPGPTVSSANLSWSPDGKFLVFEVGGDDSNSSIYLAYADGTGLIKLVEAGHEPAISADGNCLAYIQDQQVYLLNLTQLSLPMTDAESVWLAELPPGRGTRYVELERLQWRP